MQHLGEKPRIEQMQYRMFHTADVLIHVHPVIRLFFIKRKPCIMRIGVAQIIPGGAHKGVHGIGFTLSRATAVRTGGMHKFRAFAQRRFSLAGKLYILRQ